MFANNIVAMFFLIRTKPKLLLKINFKAMDALKNRINNSMHINVIAPDSASFCGTYKHAV